MVLSRGFEPPDLLAATLTGVVTAADQATLVAWVRETLQRLGEVRLLVRLRDFGGWAPDASLEDVRLWLQDSDRVARMAIVGDAAWRISLLTFIAQPLRRTPIEYFDNEADARRWLGRAAAGGSRAAAV